ncbi:MFS transporter [Catellatospora sp. TT07R-123]|uniref:MFS transporter n=1 Tax=Catellatospora sp. TT07R-123 TaxID=2733863 RepID=UPI001B174227|nr:MFS transporter [Catellatospora sp. TT07R-123]GHJ43663.1 MFS transporter [Catellatospora sp. TT07R-123]
MERNPWPWPSLLLLSSAVFVSVTTELVPTGLLLGMSRDLGVSPSRLGLLVTGYAAMVALFAAPLGTLTARLPRRELLVAALAAYTASNAVMLVAPNYPVAFGARLLGGITHGLFWAVVGGFAARLVSPDRVGRAVTVVSAGGGMAVLIGVPAGTSLGTALGWRAAFGLLTAVAVGLTLLAWRLLPQVPGSTAAVRTPMRAVLRLPSFPPVVAMTAVTMLGAYLMITYTAPLLHRAGLAETQLAPVLLANGLAGTLMLPVAGWVADRRLRIGVVAAGGLLLAGLVLLWWQGTAMWAAITAVVLFGFGMGLLPIFMQALTLRVAPEHTEQASGINASAYNVGVAGGALIGAFALDTWGLGGIAPLGVLLVAAGMAVYVVGSRRTGLAAG